MNELNDAKWVVLFISKKREQLSGYKATLDRMLEKVKKIPGFVAIQTFTNEQGQNLTVSYWKDREAINQWGSDTEHIQAQKRGIVEWYSEYQIIVCSIDDYYGFKAKDFDKV